MNKKRKIYILGSALAVVLVIIIAFYFFHQIRLGVQDDNLSNLSAFGTRLDAHFDEMNDKYFSLLENCLATVHSSSYDSREDILDYFKDRHDIWNYRTAGVMNKKGEYVTIDGDTGRLKDLSFTEENAGYIDNDVLETTARSFRNFIIAAILVTIVLLLFFCTIHFTGRQHIIEEKNREILSKEQISKQRLETALEEAKRANQAKSVFLSNMSHDIRTPMNAIIGMTRIALPHIDKKEKVRDCLEKISASSAHLLSLINDVLDMSRIESGRLTLNSEQFNLKDLMDTLIGIIQPQISSGHFDFTVDMEDVEHLDLIGDPLRFKQLFLNIVGNSVKFTDPGGRIAVKVQELPSPSEDPVRLRFIFSDTGIGMSPEFLKRMFQPFERSDVPRASQMEGTGLGMAITKNITELMKGSIRAESKEGEGTTFYIELPFQKGAPQPYHPDPFKQDLPVIAMTADAFAEDRQQALDAGMNGHISKPIDLRELYNILEKYLA